MDKSRPTEHLYIAPTGAAQPMPLSSLYSFCAYCNAEAGSQPCSYWVSRALETFTQYNDPAP